MAVNQRRGAVAVTFRPVIFGNAREKNPAAPIKFYPILNNTINTTTTSIGALLTVPYYILPIIHIPILRT